MATKKMNQTTACGTKGEGSVVLGTEFIARVVNKGNYPVCDYAQKVINALEPGLDESSLYHLTSCFRGFSEEMQTAMADYIIKEHISRITGEEKPPKIGLFHVDRLLMEIMYILDHDTKNLEFYEYEDPYIINA